jgi:hypothetical protein
MADLATAASFECYCIYPDIIDLILPMPTIVALGICSAQSTLREIPQTDIGPRNGNESLH